MLAEPVDIDDRKGALDIHPEGNIVFDLEEFKFTDDDRSALRDVRFTLKRGETLGIVGKTGSGKSAILRLLLREFENYSGDILFGGRSINDYKKKKLREAIGYVPQDHFLFSTTVAGNIAFARPEATEEEIHQAAQLAHIHQDILNFTEGYNTVVGERGVSLSGG